MAFTAVELTGIVLDDTAAPEVGASVVAYLVGSMTDGTTLLAEDTAVGTVTAADGTFSLPLFANDDPTTLPKTSAWQVTITATSGLILYEQLVVVPAASAPSDELFELAPPDN